MKGECEEPPSNTQVTGTCAENAVEDESMLLADFNTATATNSHKKMYHHHKDHSSRNRNNKPEAKKLLSALCKSDGKWHFVSVGCLCVRGFQPNHYQDTAAYNSGPDVNNVSSISKRRRSSLSKRHSSKENNSSNESNSSNENDGKSTASLEKCVGECLVLCLESHAWFSRVYLRFWGFSRVLNSFQWFAWFAWRFNGLHGLLGSLEQLSFQIKFKYFEKLAVFLTIDCFLQSSTDFASYFCIVFLHNQPSIY